MASKKGIIVTCVILAVIAVSSFFVWIIPQNHGSLFVVSDYRNELDGVIEKHNIISDEVQSNLNELLSKAMTSDEFISKSQASSSQITSLITELIESNPPSEWKSSYLYYGESLKKYNDYLSETISFANKMKNEVNTNDLSDELKKLDSIKKESEDFSDKSNSTRPQ